MCDLVVLVKMSGHLWEAELLLQRIGTATPELFVPILLYFSEQFQHSIQ